MTTRRGRGRPPHPDVLTPTEWRILDAIRHGMTRREIARRRGTSLDAVRYHVANIGAKVGVHGVRRLRHWPGVPLTSPRQPALETAMPPTDLRLGPLGQVSLYVRDVAAAEAFYRDTLGLAHHFTFGDLAFFDLGGTRLYVHAVDAETWRPGSVLYVLVDDIAAAQQALTGRGVRFSGAPHRIYTDEATGVEEWMTFFEDPSGNQLALMARVGPSADVNRTSGGAEA
jgi:DNA-binding CsgD family transcriptional regulator/catechol 2,3-dioxygenase-like lactoylglutathione lyase family enzyme